MLKRLLLLSILFTGQAWAANKYWNPTDGTNWNTAANWSPAGIPGTSDIAIFNADTNNTSCAINANISVAGILITNYTGTITQESTRTVTVGTSGYTQYSGTFAGGDALFTVYRTSFRLIGGTFTAPSDRVLVTRAYNNVGGPIVIGEHAVFNHNNGMFDITSGHNHIDVTLGQRLVVNNLRIRGGINNNAASTGAEINSGGVIEVLGNVELYRDVGTSKQSLRGGTLDVHGDVTIGVGIGPFSSTRFKFIGAANQTFEFTDADSTIQNVTIEKTGGTLSLVGTITLLYGGSWTYNSGALDAGDSLVRFRPHQFNNVSYEITITGTHELGNVEMYPLGGGSKNGTLTVSPGTTLTASNIVFYGGTTLSRLTGDIQARGDVELRGAITALAPEATLRFIGDHDQTLYQQLSSHTGPRGHWTVDKSGGTLTLASDITLSVTTQDLLWQSGAMDVVTNTLSVGRNLVVTNALTTLKWAYDSVDNGLISATAIDLDGPQNLVATWAGVGNPKEGTFNVMTWTSATGPGTPDISVSGLPSGYRGLVQYSEGGKYIRLAVSQDISGEGEAFLVPNTLLVPNRLLVNEVSP